MLKMAPSSCVVLYHDGQFKCQMNLSETVSQIKYIYAELSVLPKILDPDKLVRHIWLWPDDCKKDNNTSSTIPPVTFKLMMVSSNYCFLWTDEGPHSANPSTVDNGGPALTWFVTLWLPSANNFSRRYWRCSHQPLVRAVIVSWCAPISVKVRLLTYHVVITD